MPGLPRRKHELAEIVAELRPVDVLLSQGRLVSDAIRTIGVTPFTYDRWRKAFAGLRRDRVKRLKDLEKDRAIGTPWVRATLARERLRKAVSDLTREQLILREAASGNV